MARAIRLAARGLYSTTPNPRVGCVIAREDRVVGEGWHLRAGEPHAEAHALAAAGPDARGATAYVSLEPCSHHGRTPPCARALAEAGIARVVAAMSDPNPLVSGKGTEILRAAGIRVEIGLLEREATEINLGFVSRMTRQRPWVRLKLAASLDGKTALAGGASKWITGPEARRDAHHWRARSCAVLTGVGTVRDDDPRLTVRDVPTQRQPLRVVVDSRLETPVGARILDGGNVLIATAVPDQERLQALGRRGAEVVVLPDSSGKVALASLFRELSLRGVNEVLCEAGAKLNGSLLRAGCVDELLIYLAPSLLGEGARGMFDLPALTELDRRWRLDIVEVRPIGADLRVRGRLVEPCAS
jgi:diaminohydroxyphosphoribosylaminopyrimidine deaminase/5-amino-6-(5-phosphoribosylamino)uracil reductase